MFRTYEKLASKEDREDGKDLADYLIKQDWRLFRKQYVKEVPQLSPIKSKPHPVKK